MEDIDPYEVLGVKEDAKPDQVRKAYKNLAMKLHPEDWDKDASIAQREKVWKEYSKQGEEYYEKLQIYLKEQLKEIEEEKKKLSGLETKLKIREKEISSKEKQLDDLLYHISKSY